MSNQIESVFYVIENFSSGSMWTGWQDTSQRPNRVDLRNRSIFPLHTKVSECSITFLLFYIPALVVVDDVRL